MICNILVWVKIKNFLNIFVNNKGQQMIFQKHRKFLLITLFFGVVYALISIVNHYLFRTYALDLGVYTNALFDYRNFRFNDSLAFKEICENLLADHFDLYLVLFSPLSYLFGTYTLLIIQIVFILLGGFGVYCYFKSLKLDTDFSIPATLFFYMFFGVFAAVSFDYHSNVVAAVMVPWFFYFVKQKSYLFSSLMLLFIVVSKENISLWMVFICIGLLIEYRKDVRLIKFLSLCLIFCVAYFLIITSLIMPMFSNSGSYPHFNYSYLGNSMSEALLNLFIHPINSFKMLFVNHTNHINGDYVKLELHILVLLSGLPFLVRKPQYFIMLIPVYFQKLFHDNYIMWGVYGQYSIEFLPVLAIGVFSVISEFKNQKWVKPMVAFVLITTLASTIRLMDNTVMHNFKSRIRIYQNSHYQRSYDVSKVHEALESIPLEAVVSAQSPFLPQLSLRDKIYQFPIIKDAEFIIYSTEEETYPMEKEQFIELTKKIENDSNWVYYFKNEPIVILKRK